MLEKTEGEIKNGQSRETGNIGHRRHRMKTNKTKNTTQKTEGATKNGQSRDTGNMGYTRHRMKTNKTKKR